METWTALLVFVVIAASAVWWFVPKWQVRKLGVDRIPDESTNLEDQFRKTITTALTGAFVLLGATVGFAQLTEMGRVSDLQYQSQLLAKAFELLGKQSVAEHLGGIRLLKTWADRAPSTADEDRIQILADTMLGFVRDRTKFDVGEEDCRKYARPGSSMVPNDVQVALDILKSVSRKRRLELDFRGLNLSRADLSGAYFTGSTFAFSDLSEADLSNAQLNDTDFYCANLYKARLSGADLSAAGRSSRRKSTNMIGTLLIKANLEKAKLKGVNLSDAQMNEVALVETELQGAVLANVNLYRARLEKVVVDQSTDLYEACLVETVLVDTDLRGAKNMSFAVEVDSGWKLAPGSHCTR